MQTQTVAEWLLKRVMGPQRAEEVYGDLLEGAKLRGSLWFWRSVIAVVAFYDSPWQLVALTILCGLLSAASFMVVNAYSHSKGSAAIIASLALVFGLLSTQWAAHAVSEGVRTQRWSEETIDHFRQIVKSKAWNGAFALLTIVMISSLVPLFRVPHIKVPFWSIFSLQQALTQIALAFGPSAPSLGPISPRDWSLFSPIHSQHWGER